VVDKREAPVLAALRELERAERDAESARTAFWRAVAKAHDEGLSYAALARLLGISRQRAAQLVEKGR
jgi:hypothetical protein